jgi:tetratricopeptide (TPR) repeat protein
MHKLALKSVILALLTFSGQISLAQQPSTSPKSFDRLSAQAEHARSSNRIEEAIELYRKGLSLRPRWAEGWWYLGTLFYERDAFADAAVAFKRASTLSPNLGTAWVMLGLCEFKLGRHTDALKHIQHGRQLGVGPEPQLRHVMLYHEGLLLIGKGDFERAQETLSVLSQEGVENEELTTALGLSVLRARFSDLLGGSPGTREVVRRAGWAEHLAAQKEFDEALSEYDRLAADFPKLQGVQYAYGRFLININQDEKAIAAFKRELENTPNHLPARLSMAATKLRLKDAAGGLAYAEEAVKLYPKVPLGHLLLGLLLIDVGQTLRAIDELETARRALPNEPQIYFALGRAYSRAGRKADAAKARATFTRLNNQTNADEGPPSKADQQEPSKSTKPMGRP